jgi:xanthine dehydrogenase accessory factor
MYNDYIDNRTCAVVLGTNEVASAVGVRLSLAGWTVILSQDKADPVLRRKTSFHDVLFGETVTLSGVTGSLAETAVDIVRSLRQDAPLVVTPLDLMDLITVRKLDLLVDARTGTGEKPDLRWLAQKSIGIGKGYATGVNCDKAIGFSSGLPTQRLSSRARRSAAANSYVVSPTDGDWHTAIEIGLRVYVGTAIGSVNGFSVYAPCCGTVSGIVRDGTAVRSSAKLAEIVPEYQTGTWEDLDRTGHMIGQAMMAAIDGSRPRWPDKHAI